MIVTNDVVQSRGESFARRGQLGVYLVVNERP
jgi:hypothetical protein